MLASMFAATRQKIAMAENCVSFPRYSLGERVADGCLHAVGVTASLVALTVLLVIGIKSDAALWVVSLTVYGLALVATFSFSAGYNLVARPPRLKEWLRRFDHAAIFLMIAGTYTPFVLIQMNTPFGLSLLAVVWTIAAIGIVLQLFAPRYLRGLSVALYLVQGWAVLAAIEPLISAMPVRALTLLMAGGVLYTVGVVFHLWERLPYSNAIWHGFVLAAASCHFTAVIFLVAA
jgi:hemolysin III